MSNSNVNSVLKEVLGTSIYILVVLLIALFRVKFIGQRTVVIGQSMERTLSNGDNLIVNKIGYRLHDPERFDIVVFPYRNDRTQKFVKRIIGLPGETVQIIDGVIYINGEVLEEYYGKEFMVDGGVAIDPVLLSEDEYFVLGDNRNNSMDSRVAEVGNIKRDELIGKVWIRITPFSEFGKVE